MAENALFHTVNAPVYPDGPCMEKSVRTICSKHSPHSVRRREAGVKTFKTQPSEPSSYSASR